MYNLILKKIFMVGTMNFICQGSPTKSNLMGLEEEILLTIQMYLSCEILIKQLK